MEEEKRICGACEIEKPISKFSRSWDSGARKRVCRSCYSRRDRARLKLDMLQAFGWKCQCCGESNPYFLTLDHVKNDGAEWRAKTNYNEQQIYRLARRQGFPRDTYACLCMNCNFAKGHFGICPHQAGISGEKALEDLRYLSKGTEDSLINKEGWKKGWFKVGFDGRRGYERGIRAEPKKLTDEQVQSIRLRSGDCTPHRVIASEYGVSRQMIDSIISGKRRILVTAGRIE
jgi:hypothetical protein